MIGGRTRVFALLGDPVSHSLSPAMHNAAFRVLGLDAVYVPFPCAAEEVPALMRALAQAGGGGNVTVPHKEAAAGALDRASERVAQSGTCNTFWFEEGRLQGDSTDVDGILAAVDRLGLGADAWLVIGTGGSARAVAEAARLRGARLAVISRDPARRAAFASRVAGLGIGSAAPEEAALVINATPLGLRANDPLPLPVAATPAAAAALDMVYRPGGTHWVREHRLAGRRADDGREVLVAQGAAALSRWFPLHDPPVEVMRAAVRAALG